MRAVQVIVEFLPLEPVRRLRRHPLPDVLEVLCRARDGLISISLADIHTHDVQANVRFNAGPTSVMFHVYVHGCARDVGTITNANMLESSREDRKGREGIGCCNVVGV